MEAKNWLKVGVKARIIKAEARYTEENVAGDTVEIVDMRGANTSDPGHIVQIRYERTGRTGYAYLMELAPSVTAKQELETQRAREAAALDLTDRKLAFIKATKAETFDPATFKAWETVRIMADSKLSHVEKADQLAALGK